MTSKRKFTVHDSKYYTELLLRGCFEFENKRLT